MSSAEVRSSDEEMIAASQAASELRLFRPTGGSVLDEVQVIERPGDKPGVNTYMVEIAGHQFDVSTTGKLPDGLLTDDLPDNVRERLTVAFLALREGMRTLFFRAESSHQAGDDVAAALVRGMRDEWMRAQLSESEEQPADVVI